jgi:predicted GNAT family N-acyltransferase
VAFPKVHQIGVGSPLYAQAVALRERVLLKPIGYTAERFAREYPEVDQHGEHFVAVIDHPSGKRVIGTVCLLPDHPRRGVGKLTQMVVDEQRQREGLGRELIAHLERRAFGELGLESLFCHAQDSAAGFYRKVGWTPVGPGFTEAGIPHIRMEFRP